MELASAASDSTANTSLKKELNLFDAVGIVVGTTIGSGIFLIPSSIAADLHSLGTVLIVWTMGGILSVFGALSLAELGAMYPSTGGLCTYLERAYGPLTAFLYAWGLLLMIHTGSIAALAVGFGIYLGQILPLTLFQEKALSLVCILIFTVISCLGIRGGKLTQNVIAVAKVSGLAGIILLLWIRGSRPLYLFGARANDGHPSSISGVGIAMVAVLFAYEGWHVISFVAGEMRRPQADLPRGLFYGTAIIMLIYLMANLGYYHLLSPAEIRGTNALAAFAVGKVLGSTARMLISALILVSILGSMNGLILTGPRVYYAMARDGAFPRLFGEVSHGYRTPMRALIVQGIWAAVLAASGSYEQLFTDVIFVGWIFYGLGVVGVLVLRHKQPQLQRPFRVPGYPWVCILFAAGALDLVFSTIVARPGGALLGVLLIISGIPIYFVIRSSAKTRLAKLPE